MSNPPAFPIMVNRIDDATGRSEITLQYEGMSLRDYFAAKAMAVIIQGNTDLTKMTGKATPVAEMAKDSYIMADAMLTERNKSI